MDTIALVNALCEANKKTPPTADALKSLGKAISVDPEWLNQPGGVNRFDEKPGYGYSAQTEREPIFLLSFVIADIVREGLRPEYLRKLYQCYNEHPEWFGLK